MKDKKSDKSLSSPLKEAEKKTRGPSPKLFVLVHERSAEWRNYYSRSSFWALNRERFSLPNPGRDREYFNPFNSRPLDPNLGEGFDSKQLAQFIRDLERVLKAARRRMPGPGRPPHPAIDQAYQVFLSLLIEGVPQRKTWPKLYQIPSVKRLLGEKTDDQYSFKRRRLQQAVMKRFRDQGVSV